MCRRGSEVVGHATGNSISTMTPPRNEIKRVAIIGAGPSGVIALDAFIKEQAFDVIRVFERRERAGGVWCV